MAYIQVAKRVAIAPLSFDARALLFSSAGATKFTFGLELGSCTIALEKKLRTAVLNAIWQKRPKRCPNLALALCFKGHMIDPVQLKLIWPFHIARRQLRKHESLGDAWTSAWHRTFDSRNKSTMNSKAGPLHILQEACNAMGWEWFAAGPLHILQEACNAMGWEWFAPFDFYFPFNAQQKIVVNLLAHDDKYFHHILRLGISMSLWKKTVNSRKSLGGLQHGVDKTSTLCLLKKNKLPDYHKGMLRGILADAITTEHSKYKFNLVAHPICPAGSPFVPSIISLVMISNQFGQCLCVLAMLPFL